jgi:hypothetical protein
MLVGYRRSVSTTLICSAVTPSFCPIKSRAVNSGRYAIPKTSTMMAESNFRFRCFCNGPLVVNSKVHPLAGFVLLPVIGARPSHDAS